MDIEDLKFCRRTLKYVEDELHPWEKASPQSGVLKELRRLVHTVRRQIEAEIKKQTGDIHNGGTDK